MKLLVINLDKGIFSAGSASLERLKEYSRLVDKIFVIVWTLKKEEPIIWQDKLFVYPTNSCCRLFYYFDSFRLARKILKKDKIDLIFTQDPFETGLAGRLIAARNNLKLQIQIHTDFLSPYFRRESFLNILRVRLAKFLLPKADSIRVVSQRIRNSLKAASYKLKAEPVVLPIFVDAERIKNTPIKTNLKQKYPQFDRVILAAGRLSREKNIGLAIEVMREIVKKYPKTGLIIVGSGPEEADLKFKIKNLKLRDNIVMEAWTDDLASYLKTADLFLVTSNYEGWSMAAVEALAAGCPVVMTDVGCAGELIVNGESGLVVPVGSGERLVEAILKIFENENLRKKIKNNAIPIFNWLLNKEQTMELYKKSWEIAAASKP
ncbi:MAG: glycosyltransferase [Patescibacteria group bacterium]|nr:glycosyltransferase [Patescibacteria group bacterium]